MIEQLKPCPFCNEEKELMISLHRFNKTYFVECKNCGCRGPIAITEILGSPMMNEKEGMALAIDSWNLHGKGNKK